MTNTEAAMIILDAAAEALSWEKNLLSEEEAEGLEMKRVAFLKASELLLHEERDIHRDIKEIKEEMTVSGFLEDLEPRKCVITSGEQAGSFGFHGFYPGIPGQVLAALEDKEGRVSYIDATMIRFIKESDDEQSVQNH